MKPGDLPARLKAGIAGTAMLAAACCAGPWLLPRLPGNDPARSALLPPGSQVTAVERTDGVLFVSPEVEVSSAAVVVHGPGDRVVSIPRAEVREVSRHRFLLGSDRFGRDLLAAMLSGGRISLAVASLSLAVALLLGLSVGLAAGSSPRLVDSVLMRLVDALLAFPVLFLMILCVTLFRPGPGILILVLGLTSWMGLARLVRGQVLSLRRRQFILASRAIGAPWHRIWRTHFIPNIAGPVAQDAALRMGDLVLAEATLSFLGLGIPPSTPTWGSLIAQGQKVLADGWWLATFPGIAIAVLIISLALIGDGLQEALRES